METPAQLRAARALLGLTQAELAAAAAVSIPTIKRAEADGGVSVARTTIDAIRTALEAAGVEFTNGDSPGVRLRPRG